MTDGANQLLSGVIMQRCPYCRSERIAVYCSNCGCQIIRDKATLKKVLRRKWGIPDSPRAYGWMGRGVLAIGVFVAIVGVAYLVGLFLQWVR